MVVQVNDVGMVRVEELRVGNFLKSHSNIIEVTAIGKDRADLILRQPNTAVNWSMLYSDLQPIQLTEEILLKLGFEVKSNAGVKYISFGRINKSYEVYLPIVNNILCLSIWQNKMFLDLGTRIKYLHQLQNLYFALTGQELEINL